MSKETSDTLGNQKRFNYALQAKSKEQFVEQVLDRMDGAEVTLEEVRKQP